MTGLQRLVPCLTLILMLAVPARSEELAGAPSPFEVVRALQRSQDQIVQGKRGAQSALRSLMAEAGERLLAADPAAWRDPKNARAVVIYGLSGGLSRVIRDIARLKAAPEPERTLIEGTLAYLEGREGKAKEILLPIDAGTLPPPVGGHLAMAQSILVAKDDPRRAIALLDQARLISPGTLIEETSLRREVLLVEAVGDIEKLASLSSQYLRRFVRSAYAGSFRERFAASVLRLGASGDMLHIARLERILDEIEPADRLSLYLRLARAFVIGGRLEPARLYAARAIDLAPEGTGEAARAKLYEAAALVLIGNIDAGLGTLESLDAAHLPKADADLKDAALAMARHIRLAEGSSAMKAGPGPGSPERLEDMANAPALALIDRAEKAIAAAAELLHEGAKP